MMKALEIKYILLCLLSVLVTAETSAQSENAVAAPSQKSFGLDPDQLGTGGNIVNQFNGEVSFPLSLGSVSANDGLSANISLLYSSAGIYEQVSNWNKEVPTGVAGLGWSFDYPKIVVDNKLTGTRIDDEFYLVEGGVSSKLILVKNTRIPGSDDTSGPRTYQLENHQFWKITYYETEEKWEIIKENGHKYIYGDKNSGRNTVQWVVYWDNWIGNSSRVNGQDRQGLVWNLCEISNRFNQSIQFTYLEQSNQVGSGGLEHTEASYLSKIEGAYGERIDIEYGNKKGEGDAPQIEWYDPHTEEAEPDGFQERYERKYIDRITQYNEYGYKLSEIDLKYDLYDYNDGSLTFYKRRLLEVENLFSNGESGAWIRFDYADRTKPSIEGKLTGITSSSGTSQTISYYESGLALGEFSQKASRIYAPDGYSEPSVYVGSDYVVVLWRQLTSGDHVETARNLKVEIYTWDGGWKKNTTTYNIPQVFAQRFWKGDWYEKYVKNNFYVDLQENYFQILHKDQTDNTYDVKLFHKTSDGAEKWHYQQFSSLDINTPGLSKPKRALSKRFSVLGGGVEDDRLFTFIWNGSSWNSEVLTEGVDVFRFDVAGTNNWVLVHSKATVSSAFYFFFLDEDNQWLSRKTVHSSMGTRPENTSFWYPSNSFAVVNPHDNKEHIVQWNKDYSSFQVIDGFSYDYDWGSDVFVIDNEFIGIDDRKIPMAIFTGDKSFNNPSLNIKNGWVFSENILNDQFSGSANYLGRGTIYYKFNRTENHGHPNNGGPLDLYDRYFLKYNNASYSWSVPSIPIDEEVGLGAFSNLGRPYSILTEGDVDAFDDDDFYASINLAYLDHKGDLSTSWEGQTYYLANEDHREIFDVSTNAFYVTSDSWNGRASCFKNGGFKDAPATLYGYTRQSLDATGISDDDFVAPKREESLANGRIWVAPVISPQHDFPDDIEICIGCNPPPPQPAAVDLKYSDLTSLRLNWVTERNKVYPVKSIVSNDGVHVEQMSFKYELGNANYDVTGTLPQFAEVTAVPGSVDPNSTPFGYTKTYFFNGLSEAQLSTSFPKGNNGNANTHYNFLKGGSYKTSIYNSSDDEISSQETSFKVIELDVFFDGVSKVGNAFYTRPVQQISTVDGITNTVNYEYDESNGAVSSTTTTNYNSTNQVEDIVSHNVYGKDKYGSSWPDQLLTPVVESYTTVNGTEVSRTATTWQDWGSGKWAPLSSYEAKASNAGNFPFTASPDLNKWQKLSEVIKRDNYGNPTETKDIEGIHSTVVMGFDGQVALGSVSNAESDEVLIENFDDGVFNDSDPRNWYSSGDWFIDEEGHLTKTASTNRYFGISSFSRQNNFIAEFDVKFNDTPANWALSFQFNKDGAASGPSATGHFLKMIPGNATDNIHMRLKNGSDHDFFKTVDFGKKWNHFRVVREGNHIWVYLNQDLLFEEAVTGLESYGGKFNFYASNITCQIDNIRIYPSDAYASSSTYDKDYGYVKEQIGESGLKTQFLYNAIQQQVATINTEGLVSETSMGYNSAEFNNGAYDPADPHISHQTTVRGEEGFYDDFNYNEENWLNKSAGGGNIATWQWGTGYLIHTNSGGPNTRSDNWVDSYRIPIEQVESGRVGFEFDLSLRTHGTGLGVGAILGGSNWTDRRFVHTSAFNFYIDGEKISINGGTAIDHNLEEDRTYRFKIVADIDNQEVTLFLNGKQLGMPVAFKVTESSLDHFAFIDHGKQAFPTGTEVYEYHFDNFTMYTNPIQSSTFHAAGGRTLQAQTEEEGGLLISEPIYDGLGRPHIQTVPTKVAANTFEYRSTFVDSYNPTTGVLTGEVRTGNGHDYAYSKTRYDDSPLSRVLESSSPGASMQMNANPNITADHTVEYAYGKLGDFIVEMNLPAGISLFPDRYAVSKTIDPDGFASYQVSDKVGRTVLSKTGDKVSRNIYDRSGNLVEIHPPNYFAPPAGSTSSDWIVRMTYDYQGRLTTRTINDAGTSRYYYDEIGRSKGMRDSRAWEGIYCTYTDYDELGRVTEEGYEYKPDIEQTAYIGNISGVTKTVAGGEVIGDGTINSDAWVYAQAINKITLSGGFRVESGSRFRTEHLAISGGTKIWRKRFTYEDHSDNTFLRGALTKVEVNNDLEADVEVEESYTYNKYGELLEKGIKVVDYQNQTHSIGYDYDNVGNITKVDYGVGMEDVYYHHDIAGRLKSIGTEEDQDYFTAYDYDENGGLGTEYFDRKNITRTYSYHDEGWLHTMDDDYFTETLTYTSGGYSGYSSHTGIIASTWFGFKWSGAPSNYSYKYRYDVYGQLTEGNHSIGSDNDIGLHGGLSYDANGNIVSKQVGGPSSPSKTYHYYPGTNKVEKIGNGSDTDYHYDQAGNVIASLPKGIGEIVYDQYFNLTKEIRIEGSNILGFQYGSNDQRVLKAYTIPSSPGLVPGTPSSGDPGINPGSLQNCVMYVRGASDYPLIEKHRYEDGSEDLRYYIYGPGGLIATRESQIGPSTVSETATLEAEYRTAELAAFGESINQGELLLERIYDHTRDGTGEAGYSQLLRGNNGSAAGLAKIIDVNPNDLVQVEVFAKYNEIPVNASNSTLGENLGANVAMAFGVQPTGETADFYSDLVDLVNAGAFVGGNSDDSKPEGYLNYILFDENNTFVQAGFAGITENAREDGSCGGGDGCPHERLNLNISIEQTGYLYVYVSNESDKESEVYFDDMTITQTSFTGWRYILKDHLGSNRVVVNQRSEELPDEPGAVADSYSFRPFGERITTGDDDEPLLAYQYTGQEYDKEAGLHNYRARFYDSELGRFYGVDPADQLPGFSPYMGMGNNPVLNVDPDGRIFGAILAGIQIFQGIKAFADGGFNGLGDFLGNSLSGFVLPAVGGNPIGALNGAANSAFQAGLQTADAGGDFGDIAKSAGYAGLTGALSGAARAQATESNALTGRSNVYREGSDLYNDAIKEISRRRRSEIIGRLDETLALDNIESSIIVEPIIINEVITDEGIGYNERQYLEVKSRASGAIYPVYPEANFIGGGAALKGYKLFSAARGAGSATARARALGVAGEKAAGLSGAKTAIKVGGRTRIPDRIGNGLLEEVKNVKHLSFTRQLRDFHTYSQQNNLRFILHTRSSTTFSGPLRQAINNGSIIHRHIPGL